MTAATTNRRTFERVLLEDAVLTYVRRFTEQDDRGAYIEALTNRISRDFGYLREDVATAIKQLLGKGELVMFSIDGLLFLNLESLSIVKRGDAVFKKSKDNGPLRARKTT
jgi:hypothetical protein